MLRLQQKKISVVGSWCITSCRPKCCKFKKEWYLIGFARLNGSLDGVCGTILAQIESRTNPNFPQTVLSLEGNAFDVVKFGKQAVRVNIKESVATLSILGIIVQKHEWQDT